MALTLTELATESGSPQGPQGQSVSQGKAGAGRGEGTVNSLAPYCVSCPQLIILIYSFLRKAAWDYGRLALLIHNDR